MTGRTFAIIDRRYAHENWALAERNGNQDWVCFSGPEEVVRAVAAVLLAAGAQVVEDMPPWRPQT